MRSASDCAREQRALYGEEFGAVGGVIHPTSVWEAPDGRWRTIRLGAAAPASASDAFALGLCRARAQAIVTTGKILRAEPGLTHDLGAPELGPALAAWRRERLGLRESPLSVVLTRGDIDLGHPLFERGAGVIVVTGRLAAHAIGVAASQRHIEVVARDSPGIRDTVELLRARGRHTISIETGPTTSSLLYDEPSLIDELLLSIYCGSSLPPAAVGGALDRDRIASQLDPSYAACDRDEESGPWRFQRFTRLA